MLITREEARQKALEEINATILEEGGIAIAKASKNRLRKWRNIDVFLAIIRDSDIFDGLLYVPNSNPIDEMYNKLLQEQEQKRKKP